MGEVSGVRPAVCLIESVHLNSRMVSAFLLLAGLVLCLGSALGLTGSLCLTEGCKLYQGYSFLGLSLHIWGALAFGTGLVLLICPLGRMSAYRRFLQYCLWAEIVLLAWQVIYLPCTECMLVGLIWGLLALVEFQDLLSFKVWSVVFLVALVLMGKDLLHPWPVYGSADAGMQVYFSPSCPGCKSEINKLLAGGEVSSGRVAFFPVVLKAGDYERVERFQAVLSRTRDVGQAFQACWSGSAEGHASGGLGECLRVRLGLLCNRLVLARMGVHKIPLVVSGAPGRDAVAAVSEAGECGFDSGNNCAKGMAGASKEKSHDNFLRSLRHYQPDRRDGFKIPDRVSQGGSKALTMLAQVQASDQVEPPESSESDTLAIWKQHQHDPETEASPQVGFEESEDQGGGEGLVQPETSEE